MLNNMAEQRLVYMTTASFDRFSEILTPPRIQGESVDALAYRAGIIASRVRWMSPEIKPSMAKAYNAV